MAMVLGGYTFAQDPNNVPMIMKKKVCASKNTYTSVAFFSFGLFYIGQTITLSWDGMPYTMWEQLTTLLEADVQEVWDPKIQSGATFNVNIADLNGTPVHSLKSTFLNGNASWIKDVTLDLLIMSEV